MASGGLDSGARQTQDHDGPESGTQAEYRFVAKRIRFRNGERHSVLTRQGALPVHEATLYLARFRTKGRAANTIHYVCGVLAFLHQWLWQSQINLLQRLRDGHFLNHAEVERLAAAAQCPVANLQVEVKGASKGKVIGIRRIGLRLKSARQEQPAVDVATQASRLRYIAGYLKFLSGYVGATLPRRQRSELSADTSAALQVLLAHVPPVSRRAKLGARQGLSKEEQNSLLEVVRPGSPKNPWRSGFVQRRNWLIVVLLLATGMRRGELLGLLLTDLDPRLPRLKIIRRADFKDDPRRIQPNAKTSAREVELRPAIMRAVWDYIQKHRRSIKAARKFPQLIVADDGHPLSAKSIDKIFTQLREACPTLPPQLTSHVMRHTWNERFSEEAESMQLSDAVEEKARNEQQGWSENSKSAQTYTRRYASRKGRELALKLQERLDVAEA